MTPNLMMLPLKGAGCVPEAPGEAEPAVVSLTQAGESGAASFSETLRDLLDSGVDPCALILALQQAAILPEGGDNLQSTGSFLPLVPGMGGNLLPQSGGGASLPKIVSESPQGELEALGHEQLRSLLLGERFPVAEEGGGLPSLETEIPESLRKSDFKGLLDLAGDLRGTVPATPHLSASGSAPATRPMVLLPLQVPVGQPDWEGGVGERIQWMLSRNVQQAEVKLTPPELGPLEIRISLHNDQGQVSFVAAHAATREALEAAIPRLREMFNQINLNLANVDVGQQQAGGSFGREGAASDAGPAGSYDGISPLGQEPLHSLTRWVSHSLVDTYA